MRFRIAISLDVEVVDEGDSRLPYDLTHMAESGAVAALRELGAQVIAGRTRGRHQALPAPAAGVCAHCGRAIRPRQHGLAGRRRRFCTEACRSAAYRRRRRSGAG